METLENAEKRIRRDPEFGKFVRPQAIENYIKKTQLKPVVVKTKEEKKIVTKPSITSPVENPKKPVENPVQPPKVQQPEVKPKPPAVNTDFLTGKPAVTDPVKPKDKDPYDFGGPTKPLDVKPPQPQKPPQVTTPPPTQKPAENPTQPPAPQ